MNVPDLIWPSLDGDAEEAPPELADLMVEDFPNSDDSLATSERVLEQLSASEAEREVAVQARLLGLLGVISILSVVLSAVAAIGLRGNANSLNDGQFLILGMIMLFIGIQVVASMLATTRGLGPMTFVSLKVEATTPKEYESGLELRVRLINNRRSILRTNMSAINRRIDYLAVALVGLKHAVIGSGLLLVALTLVAAQQRFG